MTRAALASILAGLGVVVAVVLMLRQSEVIGGDRVRVNVEDASASQLDTVAVRGRMVRVSINGRATQIDADGVVWLESGGDAFPVRFDSDPGVSVEDHLLVTGRLRARGGRRWVAVSDWVRIRRAATPPPAPGL